MTYWATLWYAGLVIFQLGNEGQTLNDCEVLVKMMITDIEQSYSNPALKSQLNLTMFPENKFTATCETEVMITDVKYAK
jgi:hypothetical protein